MKMTRLYGLVALAVIAVFLLAVPAQALDHPWDGTKLADSTNLSNVAGSNGDSNDDGNYSGPGIETGKSWYNMFVGWVTGIFSSNDKADKSDQVSDFKAIKQRPEGKSESLKFNRK